MIFETFYSSLIRRTSIGLKSLWRKRGYWVRALLCWGIGIIVLTLDTRGTYDLRYRIRGPHNPDHRIIILNISKEDSARYFPIVHNPYRPQRDILKLTDHLYWQKDIWLETLNKLLKSEVKAIGVSFFFGDNLPSIQLSKSEELIFKNDRVIWAAHLSSRERIVRPQFAQSSNANIGLALINEDEDAIVRRHDPTYSEVNHLSNLLAAKIMGHGPQIKATPRKTSINFQGPSGTFVSISLGDLLLDRIPTEIFKDAVIIIGADSSQFRHLTPCGPMSRAEVLANITDNLVHNKWISYAGDIWYAVFLFILLLLSLLVFDRYPRSVALIFILWIGTLVAALSVWIFDSFYFWWPTLAPLIQLTVTWFTFMGYQATIIEQKNWRLHQEQKYLLEVEQLKNNFVSLISHDLKTPIAKIQAIIDRLSTQNLNQGFAEELKVIRKSSEELYRYIRSILQVTRVESRDFRINKVVTDLNELVDHVIEQLEPLAKEKNISIKKNLEPMFSMEIDATLIQEVVLNLVENAIRYTPEQGKITISTSETDSIVRFTVEDNGQGILPEEQDNVWKKFTRGKEQDLKTKGTGLGLYLVKYFIELHGGQVFLESHVGLGTKIGFSLPLDLDELNTNIEV